MTIVNTRSLVALFSLLTAIACGTVNEGTVFCCFDKDFNTLFTSEAACSAGTEELGSQDFGSNDELDEVSSRFCGVTTCCELKDGTFELRNGEQGLCAEDEGVASPEENCFTGCCQDIDGNLTLPGSLNECLGTDIAVAASLCEKVCCDVGGSKDFFTLQECFSMGPGSSVVADSECTASPSQCTCDTSGVSFEVISGCQGAAFADATEPSYCQSVVEFELMDDPATHLFDSGTTLGFPDCQVKITCP